MFIIILIVVLLLILSRGESAVLNFSLVKIQHPVFYGRESGQLGITSQEITWQKKKIPAGSMFLYGGIIQTVDGYELLNDVWISTNSGSAWNRVATLPPRGKYPGVSCFDVSTDETHVIQYDTDYALNLVGHNFSSWEVIVPRSYNASIFEYRDQPACIFDSQSRMYYFPGIDLQSTDRNPSTELWTSTDSGKNWGLQNSNLKFPSRFHQSIAFHYKNQQLQGLDVLYVLGGRGFNKTEYHDLWASSDAGVTWTQILKSYPWNSNDNEWLTFAINPDGVLVVVLANMSSNSTEIWISMDGGLKWGQCNTIFSYGLRRNILLTWDIGGFLYLGSGYCGSCQDHYRPDLWRGNISFSDFKALSAVCGIKVPEKGIGLSKWTPRILVS